MIALMLSFSLSQIVNADADHESAELLNSKKILTVREITLQSRCKVTMGEIVVDCPENTVFQRTVEDIHARGEVLFYEIIDSEDEKSYRDAYDKLELKIKDFRDSHKGKKEDSKNKTESRIASTYCGTYTLNFHALVISGSSSGGVSSDVSFDKGGAGGYSCNSYKPLSYTQSGQWGIPSWVAVWQWLGDGGVDGWSVCKATPTSGTYNYANWRTNNKRIELSLSNGSGCWFWQQTTTSIYLG